MDLQTFLISVTIFVILALLIWLITSLTVRERPFEERLEEQRKMEQELMRIGGKQGGPKKEKAKKKNKKLKGGGDGFEMAGGEKVENISKTKTTKMVELEIDPEVIETSLSEPPVSIFDKKPKSSKPGSPTTTMRPILVNKEEKSHIQNLENATELFHRHVHKDEVELKHDREGKKVDVAMAAAAINGFHSESDDRPTLANRGSAEPTKAPAGVSKSRKHRSELEAAPSDGGMTRVTNMPTETHLSVDRPTKRKTLSNDVTVSGTGTVVIAIHHHHSPEISFVLTLVTGRWLWEGYLLINI